MSKEVSINIKEFLSNISSLSTDVSGLDSSAETYEEFEKTDINPFKEELETTMEAVELLKSYTNMLEKDVKSLKSVGHDIEELDEDLG